ncbi:cyclase family protein [Calothrix sp. UHCC 0171]|uniref:cyclase family protein n=1 Tax=Calothrix sp. UHCC 0171 TaxID=3110245 RepID=UPI002B220165|nr:cyclase family protein [Calothrix sp. UHCC 0171]MEA5572010.1 cyclase family protein [Calothrix sp. UHCC 0171]
MNLDTIQSFLQAEVAPKSNTIDSDANALFCALQGLGKLNLLALRVPQKWGGKETSEAFFGEFQELLARYSGALAFLQTQHQSAAGMLAASSNSTLQEKYLPLMGSGEVLLGVGFSQLRREGEPLTNAIPVDGGYLLNGVVPWVTGWGIFHEFIVAATLPDGSAVFGIAPLARGREAEKESFKGLISFSEVADLVAMPSTNTVTATFNNWFLADNSVVFIKQPGWIHEQDKKNVLKSTFLATGCGLAGLDIIHDVSRTKNLSFIDDAFVLLQQELNHCRSAIREAQQHNNIGFPEKLHLRAWAIALATRISHATIVVSGGAANYKHHHAQRIYREVLVYTVTGQTRDVMAATLEKLTVQSASISSSFPSKTITYSHVIHLSHVIDTNIPQWQGDPSVEFITVSQRGKQGYYLRKFTMGEHSATHMNAPISFEDNGIGIDQYTTDKLLIPAVVIDIRKQVEVNSKTNYDYTLTIADVMRWEQQHGEIPPGNLVLLNTGWAQKWGDTDKFIPEDTAGNVHFPGFSSDVTKFLLKERQIAGVGIDTHGVDAGINTEFSVNRLVLEKPRIVLENLTNLHKLPAKGIIIAIAPLRLRDGSGSPVGVLALF